jgi:hypothetical protein
MPRPHLQRVPEYYHKYISKAEGEDLADVMDRHRRRFSEYLRTLPREKWDYRYAEGKWSVKELVQHIIDSERVFNYRALSIARGDSAQLPGFDENVFAKNSGADSRTPEALLEELESVQTSTALLFKSFSEEQLERSGTANGQPTYVRALGFINAGHALHHMGVLQERYMQAALKS